MKSYSSLLLSLVVLLGVTSPALAQIELSTGDGNTVKVGPDGVFVQSGSNTVKIPATSAKVGRANLKTTKTVTQVSKKNSGASRTSVINQTTVNTTVIPGNLATGKNIMVSANNLEATYMCNGDSCTIFSNNCTIRLNGNCRVLSITGNNNEVICENIAAISITGNNNTVTWKAGTRQPSLSVLGNQNETRAQGSN
jgi:hypothetical protein